MADTKLTAETKKDPKKKFQKIGKIRYRTGDRDVRKCGFGN